MAGSVQWMLLGALGALLGVWLVVLVRRWYHHRRYGLPIAHEDLLVQYGRRMAALLDREALARLLAEDVSGALDASRATVLLADNHNLVTMGKADPRGISGSSPGRVICFILITIEFSLAGFC